MSQNEAFVVYDKLFLIVGIKNTAITAVFWYTESGISKLKKTPLKRQFCSFGGVL